MESNSQIKSITWQTIIQKPYITSKIYFFLNKMLQFRKKEDHLYIDFAD